MPVKHVIEQTLLCMGHLVTLTKEMRELTGALARMVDQGHSQRMGLVLAEAEHGAALARTVAHEALRDVAGRPSRERTEQQYMPPERDGHIPTEVFLVSSARLERRGAHDVLTLWNRGTCCGELVVSYGDGIMIAQRLGLVERRHGTEVDENAADSADPNSA